MKKSELSKYMSKIAKLGHKKNPRPKEFYQKMRARVGHKGDLSPDNIDMP